MRGGGEKRRPVDVGFPTTSSPETMVVEVESEGGLIWRGWQAGDTMVQSYKFHDEVVSETTKPGHEPYATRFA